MPGCHSFLSVPIVHVVRISGFQPEEPGANPGGDVDSLYTDRNVIVAFYLVKVAERVQIPSVGLFFRTGCSSVWSEHWFWVPDAAGSNPATPIFLYPCSVAA